MASTALTDSPALINQPLLEIYTFYFTDWKTMYSLQQGTGLCTYFRPFTINICQKCEIQHKWHSRSMPSEVLNIHCFSVNIFLSIEVNRTLKLKTT